MASWSWKLYVCCLSLLIFFVFSTLPGAYASERCERREPQSFQGFQTAPSSVIRRLLADYLQARKMKSGTRVSSRPREVCITQGNECQPGSSTPCCGRMGCYTYSGEECEQGDNCICRNNQYHRDPYF
ncbi:uncharacterized protein [Diadema antillarum]|uniref:uncharacterized protein n=1 Tax=Diadema antillarum TaxID=105358 RepID=UPI003A8B7BE0